MWIDGRNRNLGVRYGTAQVACSYICFLHDAVSNHLTKSIDVYFIVGSNFLKGSLPSETTHLTTLRALNMEFNAIEGQLPLNMGQLSQLESLTFSVNQLGGKLPTSLCDLILLERLFLAFNRFTGELPSCIDKLQSLKQLRVSYEEC